LEALQEHPLSEVVYVLLDTGELEGTSGAVAPHDLCAGVKEKMATAAQKLDKVSVLVVARALSIVAMV
jgi:hypothetical protein